MTSRRRSLLWVLLALVLLPVPAGAVGLGVGVVEVGLLLLVLLVWLLAFIVWGGRTAPDDAAAPAVTAD